ncbi:hypothetical protein Atai01_80010 [Amycolatopsis taiwanensis]|uniref:Uncharacterized protein n=1 Tax=Amycolatopsis taiwanensis TaxID=342230 RepID=A0A9W6RC81_9PSEU|nr:hypothetical protein Atai01_80010 [Amycolatopsis taiwanensis]
MAGRAVRPDVSTGLWPGESGIPADPLTAPVSSGFASLRGWWSNVIPCVNPILIPCMNPQRHTAPKIAPEMTVGDNCSWLFE